MKRIKLLYWILSFIFLTIAVLLFICFQDKPEIILSSIAISVAVLAMGLSDKKMNYFIGSVEIWAKIASRQGDSVLSNYLSFRIVNNSKEPVYNFVYRIKLPSNIIELISNNKSYVINYYGESVLLVDDSFGFLGFNDDDNFIQKEDIRLYLNKWIKGNIFFTISGTDIKPTTFKIGPKVVEDLIKANTNKPEQAKLISK